MHMLWRVNKVSSPYGMRGMVYVAVNIHTHIHLCNCEGYAGRGQEAF